MRLILALVLVLAAFACLGPASARVDIPPVDLMAMACAGAPASDTIGGSPGTGPICIARNDAARATQVMPSTAVTASDGSFASTWPGTFPSAPTTSIAQAKTTTDPYTCQVGISTTTGYSGQCWRVIKSITLPTLASALLGLVITPATPAAAGITVMVVGRQ